MDPSRDNAAVDRKEALVDVLRSALPNGFRKDTVQLRTNTQTWWRRNRPRLPRKDELDTETVTQALRRTERAKGKRIDAKIAEIKCAASTDAKSHDADWFDMPSSELTDDVKRDLEVLSMRAAFNAKKHYKSLDGIKEAKWVQIGTVMDHPTDGKHGRLPNRLRKRTLTQQWMADPEMGRQLQERFERLDEAETKTAELRTKQFPNMARRVKRRR